MKLVTPIPNRDGIFELGPCMGGYGLGDTLSITPLASGLGQRAMILFPKGMEYLLFLFRDLCPARIAKEFPVFQWRQGQACKQKLDLFGLAKIEPLPVIKLDPDLIPKARAILAGYPSPIAFCPTCSKGWDHIRQRPYNFWVPVVRELAKRFTVCQFGRTDYPTVSGAKRMPFVDLPTLAACYHLIGNYVGVNTGDYHLMLAVGGRCVVADSDPLHPYQKVLWWFDTPRVRYAKLSHPSTVLQAMKELPL